MSAGGEANSVRVVVAALAGNLAIAISKFVAAFFSGSVATLAEAVHSVADTANQGLLLFGMRLAERPITEKHPLGRSIERYFWPFIVSVMLFTIGGAFALYEGIHKLFELQTVATSATHHETSNLWSYVVLGASFLFESFSFYVAFGEFRKLAGERTFLATLTDARDPTIPVVVLEDLSALLGLAIALTGLAASDLSGWTGFDGIASILIGLLLCAVAIFLARETHSLLMGETATDEDRRRMREIVESTPGVVSLGQLLTMHRGPEEVIVALKVRFTPTATLQQIEESIDVMERAIRDEMPRMRFIFVEPDSGYDYEKDERPRGAVLPS